MTGVLEIRPTSIREHRASPESLSRAIHDRFSREDDVLVKSVASHIVLTHARHLRRLWSPWLHVELEPTTEGSRVIARFSPHPNLWTAIALGYFALGGMLFFAGFFAVAQALLGQTAWAAWIAGACAVGLVALFVVAKVGQGLAQAQMADLATRLAEVLDRAPPEPADSES